MSRISVSIVGADEVERNLARLGKRTGKAVVRRAVSKGSTVMLKAARNGLNRGDPIENLVRRSLGRRTRTYRGSVFVAVVGPRSRFSALEQVRQKIPDSDELASDQRTYPQHTAARELEFGDGDRPARPFLRPVLSRSNEIIGTVTREVLQGLERAADGEVTSR